MQIPEDAEPAQPHPVKRTASIQKLALKNSREDDTVRLPMSVLALVACSRHRVEDFFEDGKGHLGMAQYETRSWIGWHHHMTLVALAHLFVTLTQQRLKKKYRS